jgi:hypothetical protein
MPDWNNPDNNVSQEDDDTLVTKWLLLGGVLWDSNTIPITDSPEPRPTRWFAIERDKDERNGFKNAHGATPADAIRNYIRKFYHTEGEEWLAPLIQHVSFTTSSAPTPITHPTEQ